MFFSDLGEIRVSDGPFCTREDEPIFFEVIEKPFESLASAVKSGEVLNTFVKPITAANAFRRYNWLRGVPMLNRSGNLRGMVINKRMRHAYGLSKSFGAKLAVLSALIEVAGEMKRVEKIYGSDAAASEKLARSLMLGGAAVLRSVTSVVPTAVELTAASAKGYVGMYSLATGSDLSQRFDQKADAVSQFVRTTHRKQWDGEVWYDFVEAQIDAVAAPGAR